MNLSLLVAVTGVMGFFQIGIWRVFPKNIRDILMANTALATGVNFVGSGVILFFTGTASMVGICNIGASLLFAGYAYYYRKKNGLIGIELRYRKLLKVIPLLPYLEVKQTKENRNGEAKLHYLNNAG